MIKYFGRLDGPRLILWCYLAWYIAVVCLYFNASSGLWFSAVAISLVVGVALNLAARQPHRKPDGWIVFRLFLIPFCVSSYSDLIRGNGFILVFPSNPRNLLVCALACLGVMTLHFICRWLAVPAESVDQPPEP